MTLKCLFVHTLVLQSAEFINKHPYIIVHVLYLPCTNDEGVLNLLINVRCIHPITNVQEVSYVRFSCCWHSVPLSAVTLKCLFVHTLVLQSAEFINKHPYIIVHVLYLPCTNDEGVLNLRINVRCIHPITSVGEVSNVRFSCRRHWVPLAVSNALFLFTVLLQSAEFVKKHLYIKVDVSHKCQYTILTCNMMFLMCHSWGAGSNPTLRSSGSSVVENPSRACAILVTLNWSPLANIGQCLPVGVLGTYLDSHPVTSITPLSAMGFSSSTRRLIWIGIKHFHLDLG